MTSLQVLQNKAAKIILDRAFYSSATHALACVQTSPISFVSRGEGPFPRAMKEIGDAYTHATHALATLTWFPLEKRRFPRRCIYVYKCFNGFDEHDMNFIERFSLDCRK